MLVWNRAIEYHPASKFRDPRSRGNRKAIRRRDELSDGLAAK